MLKRKIKKSIWVPNDSTLKTNEANGHLYLTYESFPDPDPDDFLMFILGIIPDSIVSIEDAGGGTANDRICNFIYLDASGNKNMVYAGIYLETYIQFGFDIYNKFKQEKEANPPKGRNDLYIHVPSNKELIS
ncbi:unnamed protein product [Rhizophagus irregularis]|nr:unnamed protein product [Rhizophagus irregularis]